MCPTFGLSILFADLKHITMLKHTISRPLGLLRPRIFDEFMLPWNDLTGDGELFPEWRTTVPAVNISEDQNSYQLSLAAPGMKKDDFRIDLDGDTLTIHAEKESEKEDSSRKFTRREYEYRSFSRSFTLPDGVDREKIDARYENGVLLLSLTKKEEARKKNPVKAITVK
jgi:HSP20 family protein